MSSQVEAYRSCGPVRGLVLLGGGRLLRKLSLWALSAGLPIRVITSPRHAEEIIDGSNLILFCEKNKIEHLTVEQISDESVLSFLSGTTEFFYLSLGAAWIFNKKLISSVFNDRLYNLHGTRLPQNRGGGGFSWQIMMGNRFGFCVLHRVDGGVDTGDIVATEEFLYPPTARVPSDYEKIYLLKNFQFIVNFIDSHRASAHPLASTKQSEWFSTYWPRLNTELNGYIDWGLDASDLERFICAFDDPYKGASTFLNNKRVFVKSVSVSAQDGCFHPFQRGLIFRKTKNWLCVAIKNASLIVEQIRDEADRDVLGEIKVGDRFSTPHQLLESALQRPFYTATGLRVPHNV
jgi:methionyl-tRNA formyltransferase